MATAQKPLMLKDFLELDSCESSASFRCAPRCAPINWEHIGSSSSGSTGARSINSSSKKLIIIRSKKAVEKLSAVVTALKLLPFASPKKLKKSFTKKSNNANEEITKVELLCGRSVTVKDIVRLGSFLERATECCSPSPAISSSTSNCSFHSRSCGSEFMNSSTGSSSQCGGGAGKTKEQDSPALILHHQEEEEAKELESVGSPCSRCQSEEEKEQGSPVSVMDFPFQGMAKAAKLHHLASSKTWTISTLLPKILHFESLAELAPLNLELRFSSVDDHLEPSDHKELLSEEQEQQILAEENHDIKELERRARKLLNQFSSNSILEPHIEMLLLDFFIDGLWNSIQCTKNADEEKQLLMASSKWMKDEYMKVEKECKRKECVKEMDRRWMCLAGEIEDLNKDMDEMVLDSLLDELVLELAMS